MTELLPKYIWHNGIIREIAEDEKKFVPYGMHSIVFQETLLSSGTGILFLGETLRRLHYFAGIYDLSSSLLSDQSGEILSSEIKRILIRNKCYQKARCHLIFQKDSETGQTTEKIIVEPDPFLFHPSKNVALLFPPPALNKPEGLAARLPSPEREYRKLVKMYLDRQGASDCLICNQQHQITETYLGNLFLVEGNTVKTPALLAGTTQGLLRQPIIDELVRRNKTIREEENINAHHLLQATEAFTAGTNGIFFIKGYESRRYFDGVRKDILNAFDEIHPGF
ncbi:MAG TPA: aminotransferase class IV [Prolixibacteraceae bacterium]|nr:aminotransferase class IV [Prolixibacteraceae bacterium]